MIAFVVVLIVTGLITIPTAWAMFPRAGDVSGITAVTFRFSGGRTIIVTTTAVGSAAPSARASLGSGLCCCFGLPSSLVLARPVFAPLVTLAFALLPLPFGFFSFGGIFAFSFRRAFWRAFQRALRGLGPLPFVAPFFAFSHPGDWWRPFWWGTSWGTNTQYPGDDTHTQSPGPRADPRSGGPWVGLTGVGSAPDTPAWPLPEDPVFIDGMSSG